MSKVAQFAVLLAALTFVSAEICAAERMALTCTGTVSSKGYEQPSPGIALIIDLDQKKVTGALGKFAVTESTENSIWFRGAIGGGMIDRKSGVATVYEAFSAERKRYALTCK